MDSIRVAEIDPYTRTVKGIPLIGNVVFIKTDAGFLERLDLKGVVRVLGQVSPLGPRAEGFLEGIEDYTTKLELGKASILLPFRRVGLIRADFSG